MAAMCPMEKLFDVMAVTHLPKGVASIRDIGIFRVSGNRPRAIVQLVGKCGIEEDVTNNIPLQEVKSSLLQEYS